MQETKESGSKRSRKNPSNRWEDLDPDILKGILSRIPPDNLFLEASCVCHAWRSAAWDFLFWSRNVIDLNFALPALNKFSSIERTPNLLRLYSRQDFPGKYPSPSEYDKMAAKLTKLLKLIMEGNDAYGHSLGDWSHSIHTIIIPYDLELSDDHLLYIAERAPGLKHLSLLDKGDREEYCMKSTFGLERKQTTDDDYKQGFKWCVKDSSMSSECLVRYKDLDSATTSMMLVRYIYLVQLHYGESAYLGSGSHECVTVAMKKKKEFLTPRPDSRPPESVAQSVSTDGHLATEPTGFGCVVAWDFLFWNHNVLDLKFVMPALSDSPYVEPTNLLQLYSRQDFPGKYPSPREYDQMAAKLTKLLKHILEGNDPYGHSLGDWRQSIHTIVIPYDLELSDDHLLYIAERSPGVKHLHLFGTHKITPEGFAKVIPKWKFLKSLYLGPIKYGKWYPIPIVIPEIVKNCKEGVEAKIHDEGMTIINIYKK
ncbi:hypothetical protein COLO4_09460 [Corchorus olitorius]|uniref:F-box domain-containing protein n=1 Tax=Corchorus olitorius TaxID=93759 RepID=A0A1R3KBZ8_9ROSI|nr:hypothetical protein COLO4_09460 [Corchorus olitorius]